jgi:hypothetical protein
MLQTLDRELYRKKLHHFWGEQARFSETTFGTTQERGPIGPLKHLAKEVEEAIKDPSDLSEFADCQILIFDAARRAGFTYDQLAEACFAKLAINKKRKWPKAKEPNTPLEHVRD